MQLCFYHQFGVSLSDIHNFSACRDLEHPMHAIQTNKNNIFLWADGWETCITAFNYIQEYDPTFHSKVRHAQAKYNYKGTREGCAEKDRKTSLDFSTRLLIKYVEKEKRVPLQMVEYKGAKIGRLWSKMKEKEPNHDLYKISITFLRKDMENYLSNREAKCLETIKQGS